MKPTFYLLFLVIACLAGRAVNAQAPIITSFSPSNGAMGVTVIISGSNFTGTTSVRFGEISAPFTVNSSTQITATVPRGASTQLINVTNASGYDLTASAFTVTRASSTLTYGLVANNFAGVNVGGEAAPAVGDLDNDGRLDLLVGRADGTVSRYEQTVANATTFTSMGNLSDASGTIDMGGRVSVSIVDANGDGKFSVFLGRSDGLVYEYEQTAVNAGTFVLVTTFLGEVSTTSFAVVGMTDFIGNGALEFLTGKGDGIVGYFGQNGVNSPSFYRINSDYLTLTSNTAPFCIDLDGNGLLDVLIGEGGGKIYRFEQSSANSSSVTQLSSNFNNIDVGTNAKPCVTDIDGDGLLDLLIGRADGTIDRYEQGAAGTPTVTSFSASPSVVCAGNQVTFTATVGNVSPPYAYTLSNGISSITGNANSTAFSLNLTASGSGSQTFTLTVNDGGLSSSTTTNVTINALPTAGLVNNGPLTCNLTNVTLTASGGSSYTFTSPGGGVLGTSGTTTTRTVSSPGSYSVTVGNANGCVSSASTTVLSNTAVITTSNPATNTVNINTPFNQTFTATGGVSPYSFSLASGSLPTGLSLSTAGVLSGTPTQGGSFPLVVRGSDANGCSDLSPNYVLTVNATPTIVGFNTLDNTVCVGSPISFTATVGNVSPPYAYTLSNGTSTTTGNTNSTAFSQNLTASGSGSQSFTLTVGDNGFQATATTAVTINALPTAGLVNNGPLTCNLINVTLTASGGTSYTFTSPGGGMLGTSGATTTRTVSTPGAYSVSVSNANGCVSSASTTVLSNTAVITTSNPATSTVNINSPFSQSFTATGGVSPYSYSLVSGSLPTGLSLSSTGVLSGTPTQGGSFTIVVRGSDANGCSDLSPNYVLTVNATPTIVGFNTLDNTVCAGSPITFTATVGNVSSNYNYTLTNGSSTSIAGSTSNTAFSQNLIASGNGPQTFTLTVSDNGFQNTATTTVTVSAPSSATIAYSGSPFLTSSGPISVSRTGTAGGVYSSSPTGLSLNTGTGQITPASSSPGSYTVTYTIAASGACPAFSTTALVGIQQPQADLTITISDGVTTAVPGGSITYTIIVSNAGPQPVTGAQVSDIFPAVLTGVSWTAVGSGGGIAGSSSGTGNINQTVNLPAGGSVIFTVTALINSSATGTLANTATVSAPGGVTDPNPANNSATDTDTLTPQADLSITCTDGITTVQAGGSVTYTITISNAGPSNAPGAQVLDTFPASLTGVSWTAVGTGGGTVTASGSGNINQTVNLPSGGSVTFTVNATLSSSATGSLANTATVSAPGGVTDPTPGNNSATDTDAITPATPTITNFAAIDNMVCVGSPITFTATVGNVNPPYAYTLSNGTSSTMGNANSTAFSQNLTAAGSGVQNFTLTVSDGGPSFAAATSVTVNSLPVASLVNNGPLTCNLTSVTLTASGGDSYTFATSSGTVLSGIGNTRSVSTSGTYSVTVANASGCVSATSTIVTSTTATPVATISASPSTTLTCAQTSLTLTAGGGNSYAFAGPGLVSQSGNTAVVNALGVYSVTISNTTTGCASTTSITISRDASAPVATVSASPSTTLTCAQTSLTLTAGGGNSYAFSGPGVVSQSGNSALVNASGVYSVTVTNTTTGCASTTSITISRDATAPTPTLSASPSTTLTCAQTSLTLTAGGGNSYAFAGPGVVSQSGNMAVVNASGIYSVTVTNTASGCASTTSISISQDASTPVATISASPSTTLTCAQTSLTLTAGGGNSYAFAGPGVVSQSGNTAVVNASGVYSVTVTNTATGCTSTTSITISRDATAPTPTLSASPSTTLTCAQTSLTLTAGGGNSYAFSGPGVVSQSGNTAVVNASGVYSVTVTNATTGCASTTSITISRDATAPTPTLSASPSTTLSCAQTSLTLTAGGGNSYAFAGPGVVSQSGNTAVVNASGIYSVTVTNTATGCTSTTSLTISRDASTPVATLSASPSTTLTCAQTSLTLTAGGGNSYAFSGPGFVSQSGNVAQVNASGTYSVTAISSNGCSSTTSIAISQDTGTPVASLVSSGTLSCAVTSVTLTASPDGQTYRFSSGATPLGSSNQAVVNASGPYSVTVLSANGCSAVASVNVSQDNTAPVASLVSSGTLSCAVTSVTLTATPNGLSYVFSAGASQIGTSNQALVNASGPYSVTVFSANGCSSVASVGVSQDTTTPTSSLVSSGSLNCSVSSVILTAGGGSSYTFSAGAIQLGTTNQATVNVPGTYSVTVANASGCVSTTSIVVSQDVTAAQVSISPASATLNCAMPAVSLTAIGSGNVVWSTGATSPVISVTTAGTYSLTLTNTNSCTATASVSVQSATTLIAPTLLTSANSTINQPISVTATGCAGTVNWTSQGGNGTATGALYTYTTPGSYTLSASCSLGQCTSPASTPLSLTISPAPVMGGPLQLLAPVYSCTTGAITFRTQGGDGTPIEYRAIGVTDWTTNPNQVVELAVRQDANSQPLLLQARQNGMMVIYTFDFRLFCNSTTPNQPPVFTQPPTQTATVGQLFSYRLPDNTFRDLNGTAVNFMAINLPDGLSYQPATRIISGTPTAVGSYSVSLTVSDPQSLSASGSLVIVVTPVAQPPVSTTVNQAPVFNGPLAAQTGTVGQAFTYTLPAGVFTDPNAGDILSYTALGLPTGLSFAAGSQTISGIPTTAGTSSVTFIATDGGGLSASGVVSVVISASTVTPPPVGTQPLAVIQPIYNCQTGAITFRTSGGDGSPIYFTSVGIVGYSTATDYVVEAAIRQDANSQPLFIKATQNGVIASYLFDFRLYCNNTTPAAPPVFVGPLGPISGTVGVGLSYQVPGSAFVSPGGGALNYTVTGLPSGLSYQTTTGLISGTATVAGSYTATVTATDPLNQSAQGPLMVTIAPAPTVVVPPVSGSALTLLAPLYDCNTGAFTFRTTGGDGTAVEYFAVGITGPTTLAGPYTVRPAADAQPFTLKARQSGVDVSYQWDFRAACSGNARLSAEPVTTPWTLSSVGNPVTSELSVDLVNASGQTIQVWLSDLNGHVIESRVVIPTTDRYRTVFDVQGQGAGLLLLRAQSQARSQTLKIMKR